MLYSLTIADEELNQFTGGMVRKDHLYIYGEDFTVLDSSRKEERTHQEIISQEAYSPWPHCLASWAHALLSHPDPLFVDYILSGIWRYGFCVRFDHSQSLQLAESIMLCPTPSLFLEHLSQKVKPIKQNVESIPAGFPYLCKYIFKAVGYTPGSLKLSLIGSQAIPYCGVRLV